MQHAQVDLNNKSSMVFTAGQLASVGLFFIFVFSSIVSHSIPLPPTLIFFVIGAALCLIISVGTRTIYNASVLSVLIITIAYLAISQIIIGAPVVRFMGVLLAMLYFVFAASYGSLVPSKTRSRFVKWFVPISLLMLIAECIWRFLNPSEEYQIYAAVGDPRWIYQYKFGGLMYVDSNGVGIHIVVLLFFLFYRRRYFNEKHTLAIWTLIILLILTISRAAWMGAFIGILYYRFIHNKGPVALLVGIFAFMSVVIGALVFLGQEIQQDLSFISKLEILEITINYFRNAPVEDIFFGIGFSQSESALGMYAHNLFMVFLIESGIVGLFLFLVMLGFFAIVSQGRALLILIPFLITTLSATITFIPYFYLVMAFMYLDTKNNED